MYLSGEISTALLNYNPKFCRKKISPGMIFLNGKLFFSKQYFLMNCKIYIFVARSLVCNLY